MMQGGQKPVMAEMKKVREKTIADFLMMPFMRPLLIGHASGKLFIDNVLKNEEMSTAESRRERDKDFYIRIATGILGIKG